MLNALCLAIALVVQSPGHDTTAAVAGRVRDGKGQPLGEAFVFAVGTRFSVTADSQGRFALRGLSPGPVHLRLQRIGFEPKDTTLLLPRGGRLVWNVVLREPAWVAERAQQESTRAAGGGLDSLVEGLVSTDTASAFTYER